MISHSTIAKLFDRFNMFKNDPKNYVDYVIRRRKIINNLIKQKGIKHIKPFNKSDWKLRYNTSYYTGDLLINGNEKKVFIKVMGENVKDCFYNEILVNNYILKKSDYLYKKCPNILLSFNNDTYYIIVYEFIKISDIIICDEFYKDLEKTLNEYYRIGLLHTDFGFINIGHNNDKYIYFDYGTSLCPISNNIRIRNANNYNHIKELKSKSLLNLDNIDFYYDDLLHLGIDINRINVNSKNYIITKGNIAKAKLGDTIIEYDLKKKSEQSQVKILVKK